MRPGPLNRFSSRAGLAVRDRRGSLPGRVRIGYENIAGPNRPDGKIEAANNLKILRNTKMDIHSCESKFVKRSLLAVGLMLSVCILACSRKDVQQGGTQETVSKGRQVVSVDDDTNAVQGRSSSTRVEPNTPKRVRSKRFTEGSVGLLEKARQSKKSEGEEGAVGQEGNIDTKSVSQYELLNSSDEKVEFLAGLSDASDSLVISAVKKALYDRDVEVRLAGMDLLAGRTSSEIIPLASQALGDKDPMVRKAAVLALETVKDPSTAKLLAGALNDLNEEVRVAVFDCLGDQDEAVKLTVFKAGISSRFSDVKENTVTALMDLSCKGAVDVLILGLRDSDTEHRERINVALTFLIGQEFNSYKEAKNWWDSNRDNYDEHLEQKEQHSETP